MDPRTGALLVEGLDERAMGDAILERLPEHGPGVRALMTASATGTTFRGVLERAPTLDKADPFAVGWTYLVARDDSQRDEIVEAIRPLADARGMKDPAKPLEFSGE